MNREQILSLVRSLACSQGMYGRLYEELMENEEYLDYLVSRNFQSDLDFILFIEEGPSEEEQRRDRVETYKIQIGNITAGIIADMHDILAEHEGVPANFAENSHLFGIPSINESDNDEEINTVDRVYLENGVVMVDYSNSYDNGSERAENINIHALVNILEVLANYGEELFIEEENNYDDD